MGQKKLSNKVHRTKDRYYEHLGAAPALSCPSVPASWTCPGAPGRTRSWSRPPWAARTAAPCAPRSARTRARGTAARRRKRGKEVILIQYSFFVLKDILNWLRIGAYISYFNTYWMKRSIWFLIEQIWKLLKNSWAAVKNCWEKTKKSFRRLQSLNDGQENCTDGREGCLAQWPGLAPNLLHNAPNVLGKNAPIWSLLCLA